jgi:hypothetical protein
MLLGYMVRDEAFYVRAHQTAARPPKIPYRRFHCCMQMFRRAELASSHVV